MLHSKYNSCTNLDQEKNKSRLLSMAAFTIGVALIVVQLMITKNTIDDLTVRLPSIIGISIFALCILFECCKPLLITLFRRTQLEIQITILLLVVLLSAMSIFTVHYTLSNAALNLNDQHKIELKSLNAEKQAYLSAVSKGVITASQQRLDEITLRESEISSSQSDITNADQLWSKIVSAMTEIMIVCCFFMSSIFNGSQNKKKVNDGGDDCDSNNDNYHTENKEKSQLSVIANHKESHFNSYHHKPCITPEHHISQPKSHSDNISDIEQKICDASLKLKTNGQRITKTSVAEMLGIPREYFSRKYANEFERALKTSNLH